MMGIGRGSSRDDEEPLRIKDEDERRALLALACEHDRVDILQNLLSGGDGGGDGGGGSSSASVAASPPSGGGGGGLDLSLLNRPPDSLIAGDDDDGDEEGEYDDEGEEGSASSGEYESGSGSGSSEGSYYSDEEGSSEYEDDDEEEGYDSDYSSDAAGPKFFVPPLHVAVASGSVAAASSLLRVGADPSVQIVNREAIPTEGSMAKFRDEGIGGAYTLLLPGAKAAGLTEDIIDRLKHAFAAEALRAIGSDEVERVCQLLEGGMPSDASVAGKDLYGWALDLEAERCGRMLNPDRWDGDVASRVKAREEEERRLRERAEEAEAERGEEEEKKRDRSPEVVTGRQQNGITGVAVDAGGDGPPRTPTKSEGGGPPPPPSSPYKTPERERVENPPIAPDSDGAIGRGRGRVLRPSSSTPLDALRTLLEEQGLVEAQLTSMRDDLIDERDLHEAVLYEAPDSGLPPRSPRRSGTHREGLLHRVRGLKAARAQRETEHEFYRERWMEAEDELAYLEQEARFDPAFRDLPMYQPQQQWQQQEQRPSPHGNGIGGPGAKGDGGTGGRDEGGVGQASAAAPEDDEEERAKLEGLVEASRAKVSKLRASVAELAERNAGTSSEVERLGLDGAVRLARSLREELREVERAASAARAGEARCRERIEWHNHRRARFLLHREQEQQKRRLENGGSRPGHGQGTELEPESETASMAAAAVSNGQNGGCANGEEVHTIVAMAAKEVDIGANVDQKMSPDEASGSNHDINGEDHPAGRSRECSIASRDLDGPIIGEKRQRGGKDVIENESASSSDERGGAHVGGKPETEHRSYVREEKDLPQPASASIATGDSTEIAVRTSARYMSLDLWDLFWRIMGLGREAVEKSKPKSRDSHNRNVMIV